MAASDAKRTLSESSEIGREMVSNAKFEGLAYSFANSAYHKD